LFLVSCFLFLVFLSPLPSFLSSDVLFSFAWNLDFLLGGLYLSCLSFQISFETTCYQLRGYLHVAIFFFSSNMKENFHISSLVFVLFCFVLFDCSRLFEDLLRSQHKPYVRKFAGESFGFLMRKIKEKDISSNVSLMLNSLRKEPSLEFIEGLSFTFFEVCKVPIFLSFLLLVVLFLLKLNAFVFFNSMLGNQATILFENQALLGSSSRQLSQRTTF